MNLANLEALTVTGEVTEPKGAATAVAGEVRVYVFLPGLSMWRGRRVAWKRRSRRSRKTWSWVSRKLANPDFLAKAAEAVVTKEREKAREFAQKRGSLDAGPHSAGDVCRGGIGVDTIGPRHLLVKLIRVLLVFDEDIGVGDVTTVAALRGG